MKHWLYVVIAAGLVACSGKPNSQSTTDDAGAPAPVGTGFGGSPAPGEDAGGGVASEPAPGSTGAPSDDGGAPAPSTSSDSGAVAPPPETGVFADAGAYVPTLGPSSDNAQHTPSPNPAGQDCMSCHGATTAPKGGGGGDGNGAPKVTQFLFAGTVWSSPTGSAPTPSAEVRVVQADGSQLVAYTDQNGNFYFLQSASGPLVPPASAGVRDATGAVSMTNVFNDGDCNSCHRLGGQAPINLP